MFNPKLKMVLKISKRVYYVTLAVPELESMKN